jgi:predicted nucleic acid-binding protein
LKLYFDTAYIAKCYLNEPDARPVRELARKASGLYSSSFCIAEMACVFHRHVRERTLGSKQAEALRDQFLEDLNTDVWALIPVSERLLHRVELLTRRLPASCCLRAGDALHLASAADAGFTEIWTNDRHLKAAARHLGIEGRSVDAA